MNIKETFHLAEVLGEEPWRRGLAPSACLHSWLLAGLGSALTPEQVLLFASLASLIPVQTGAF